MKRLIAIVLVVSIVFSLSACKKNETSGYEMKIATEMLDDGWFYYLYSEHIQGENAENFVQYGAYNLKHKKIEGYIIPIKDSGSNEIVDYAESSLPYLFLKPDEHFQKELTSVNEYLCELELSPISNETLKKLNLTSVDDTHITKLFNQMIESPVEADGKYGDLPEADIVQEALIDGYQWQVGYFIASGNIKCVRIDVLINETEYLSDLYLSKKASSDQEKLYEKIISLEESIIKQQNFVQNANHEKSPYSIQRLNSILQKIENGEY